MARFNACFIRATKPLWYSCALALVLFLFLPNISRAQGNTEFGTGALSQNTNGYWNSAFGYDALFANSAGFSNTGVGYLALYSNQAGADNTAVGGKALYSNGADWNTAIGYGALYLNSQGTANTADGYKALLNNTIGANNVANGYEALYWNSNGFDNTAVGDSALYSNNVGIENTAVGSAALYLNQNGQYNTAIGVGSGYQLDGSYNVVIGFDAGQDLTLGSNNIDIANYGATGDNAVIKIGTQGTQIASYIAGVYGTTVAGGVEVVVDSAGQLGVRTSSARFKEEIKPMDNASEAILALKPVTFRYKKDLDPQGIPQFGLVAEQVEKVDPDLVVRDEKGQVFTVRYEAVNAMLLNEFLKEHQRVQELQKQVDALAGQMKEQATLIEEVSNKVESKKLAPEQLASYQAVRPE